MKTKNITIADERAIIDNIIEGYPVKMTQPGNIVRTISFERIAGDEKYYNVVDGITLTFDNPESLFESLRRHKYINIEY